MGHLYQLDAYPLCNSVLQTSCEEPSQKRRLCLVVRPASIGPHGAGDCSAAAVLASYIETFATGKATNSEIIVWNSHIACSFG